MKIFIVVTNGQGNVIAARSVNSDDMPKFKALSAAVRKEYQSLEKEYPEPKYSIQMGVGDSLISVLRSFPEIRLPRITA